MYRGDDYATVRRIEELARRVAGDREGSATALLHFTTVLHR
jgi:hypothetical protein